MKNLNYQELRKLDWNLSGIYIITCVTSSHSYIGQAKDIRKRLREHLMGFNYYVKNHSNVYRENDHLLKAWQKYGETNFIFDILELCDINKLNNREMYWISYYNTFEHGYNMTPGGQDNFNITEWSDEDRKYFSNIKNPKPILQIDFDGNIVREFWSVAQAVKILNIDGRGIYSCCNKGISKSSSGFIWCYKEDYIYGNFDLDYYLNKKEKKPIEQYDMYGNFIKLWNHGCEVKEAGFSPSTINDCCNHNCMSVNGYIWKFQADDTRVIDEEYCQEARRKMESVKVRKVYQLDKYDNIVHIYDSIRDTSNYGFTHTQVSLCCRHKKDIYKNYKWMFEEEYRELYSSILLE